MDMFLFDLNGDGTVDMGIVRAGDYTHRREADAFENGVAGALAEINTTLKGAVDDSTAKGGTDVAMEELILLFDEADAFHFVETTPNEVAELVVQVAIAFRDFFARNDPELVTNDPEVVGNDPEVVSNGAGVLMILFDVA